MPNRILWESICTSASVAELSPEQEVLFTRLTVKCDDYGRFHADPRIILGACFPLRIGEMDPSDIAAGLAALVEADMLQLYESEGTRYLQFVNWKKFQRTRASASKFPDPPPMSAKRTKSRQPADTRGHSTADVGESLTNVPVFENVNVSGNGSVNVAAAADDSGLQPATKKGDPLFEAIIRICGWSLDDLTPTARGRANAAAKELRDLYREDVLTTDRLPGLVLGFEDHYRAHWPDADLTPQAITKHWATYMAGNLANPARRRP